MRIYMQAPSQDERAARYCQLLLQPDLFEGWNLVRETGSQGGRGRVKRLHFAVLEEAMSVLARERERQTQRGLRVVYTEGLTPGDNTKDAP